MEKDKILNIIAERLKAYGAVLYEFNGTSFIGIKNPYSDNHMAITADEEKITMEFATQAARFALSDIDDLVIHAEKYLTDQLCAVEFYAANQPLFGGSRDVSGAKFSTSQQLALWYAANNEQTARNIIEFFGRGDVCVSVASWSGAYDRFVTVSKDIGIRELNLH